jgi:RNA polymerase sigma-70 factor (ECF subfamily)
MAYEEQTDREDAELVRRMSARDARALESFYDRYNRVAFSLVLRIVKVREDAEDVLVDVFWQVWQQAPRYDASRGKPLAWLLTIARTRAIDCLRSSSRRPLVAGDPRENAPSAPQPDPFVLSGERQAVMKCLQSLAEHQRIPLEMAYFEGMSHTEIAVALNQPLGTLKDRIRAGMMQLRKCLKPYREAGA